ncbi:SWIM zinc finger family protein [Cytobacillus sp. FJAT-54145]|uniref:SWIM zinc finger family protein n=1 Tax=Cytobacillus spartinae TaxID=3299023 RepID=A0ABW6KC36_9BACI
MSAIPDKYAELIKAASVDIKSMLRPEVEEHGRLVQKGLLLYRQGLVTKIRFDEDSIHATIQDVTLAHVTLDLNFIQMSTCSCPGEIICRHQLATFFHVYSQVGSVSEWVEEWRQPIQEKKNMQAWGVQKAKDLLKASGTLKPNYERWAQMFEESFESILKGHGIPKPYLVPELFQVFTRKLRAGAPFEQEWKQLYLLIGSVHSFQKLLELSEEYKHEDIDRYYRQIFFSLIDEIEELVDRLSVHALPFAFDEFIEKLKDTSTGLLKSYRVLEFERTHLYIILWAQLFQKKAWREQEKEKLNSMYHDGEKTLPVFVAKSHQNLLLKLDSDALSMIDIMKTDATPYMLYWLEMLKAQKDWKRTEPYIESFIGQLKGYLAELKDTYGCFDFTRWALRLVSAYSADTNKLDYYEKALIQTLPYSYRDYEDFLYDRKSYEKWGELQAYIGMGISSIPSSKIKELQKEDPAILLPLYHQSIKQNIDLKNRGNYRQAVRELKKLKTLYKKLKRSDDFEEFLTILLERTKRLRAFQEECKRGKLIHA